MSTSNNAYQEYVDQVKERIEDFKNNFPDGDPALWLRMAVDSVSKGSSTSTSHNINVHAPPPPPTDILTPATLDTHVPGTVRL